MNLTCWLRVPALVLAVGCSSDESGGASAGSGGSSAGAGGTASGSGGRDASGGTSSGGAGAVTGGAPGAGGSAPTGGAAGVSGAAGTAGAAGSSGAGSSLGCNAASPIRSGRASLDVGGTRREYIIDVPDDYDPSRPYRLIFAWHWRGGSADNVANDGYYGLRSRANGSAIFVAPQGIDAGWANTEGRDLAFLRAMLDHFNSQLCIDQDRIFSTGWSFGGMMSFAIGCGMGDVFRAIAPMSGALFSGCEDGNDPVAVWSAHGIYDDVVAVERGREGRDVFLQRNHCGTETVPVEPDSCVSYQGCDEGYPVVWCEFAGGHGTADFAGESVWNFFSQF